MTHPPIVNIPAGNVHFLHIANGDFDKKAKRQEGKK